MTTVPGGGGPPMPPLPPAPAAWPPALTSQAGVAGSHRCQPPADPWAPNNPWASPWPVQLQPSVDFVTLKLDGLEIGFYRFQGGTLPHEVHVIVPRAEMERRSRATDGTEQIHRTVLSSITISHSPRYPSVGGREPGGCPQPPVHPGPGGPGTERPGGPSGPSAPEQPVGRPLPPEESPPQPAQPTQPAQPGQPALPRGPQRPFFGQPAPPGQAPTPGLTRPVSPLTAR